MMKCESGQWIWWRRDDAESDGLEGLQSTYLR